MSDHRRPKKAGNSMTSQARVPNGAKRALTRRQFLKGTAAATGAVIAAPLFVRAEALGLNGGTAANSRIVLGGIGIGPRGEFDLRWMLKENDVQFVAVCDIQKKRREFVKNLADEHHGNKDCAMYRDLREFLAARKDIDALLIATGDRWHAMATILAMESGKDVYSEKPSCMTVTEGKAVVATAKKHNRIYQTGTQRLRDDAYMRHDFLPEEPEPPKEEVDWDLWLGPCPKRPYNHEYVKGGWRGHYDFHTSCIGEWGAHTFAQCQVAIGAGDTSAIAYTYVNNKTGDGMVVKYANGVKMVLQREGWRGTCGVRYDGSEGWISVADDYKTPEVSSPALLADSDKLVKDYMERTGRPMNHVRDYFDCVKSRKQTVANPTVMHRSMSTVHACNICMWLKRDLRYDPVNEQFVDDAEANKYLARVIRKPWSLEG